MKKEKRNAKTLVQNWLLKEAHSIKLEKELYEKMTAALAGRCPVWMKLEALSEWVRYTHRDEEEVESAVYGIMKDFYHEVSPWKRIEGTVSEFERGSFHIRPDVFNKVVEIRYTKDAYLRPLSYNKSDELTIQRWEAIKEMEMGKSLSYAAIKLVEFSESQSPYRELLFMKPIRFFRNIKALKSEKTLNSWIRDYEKLKRATDIYNMGKRRIENRFQNDLSYIYESGLYQFLMEMKENTNFTIRFTNIPEIVGDDIRLKSLATRKAA